MFLFDEQNIYTKGQSLKLICRKGISAHMLNHISITVYLLYLAIRSLNLYSLRLLVLCGCCGKHNLLTILSLYDLSALTQL